MLNIAIRHFRKALRKNPNDPVTLQHIASVLHRKIHLLRGHGEKRQEEIASLEVAVSEVESLITKCVRGGSWLGAAGEILAHVFDTKRMYSTTTTVFDESSNARKGNSLMHTNRSFRELRSTTSQQRRTSLERKATSFSKIIGALRKITIKRHEEEEEEENSDDASVVVDLDTSILPSSSS